MSRLFNTDVTTKLHRLILHIDLHLILLGCLRRGSSEEIEMAHKEFKSVYQNTNKRLYSLVQKLLCSWTDAELHSSHSYIDDLPDMQRNHFVPLSLPPCSAITDALSLFRLMSCRHSHTYIATSLLQISSYGFPTWKQLKSVRLPHTLPKYASLANNLLFGGVLFTERRTVAMASRFTKTVHYTTVWCTVRTVFPIPPCPDKHNSFKFCSLRKQISCTVILRSNINMAISVFDSAGVLQYRIYTHGFDLQNGSIVSRNVCDRSFLDQKDIHYAQDVSRPVLDR